MIVRGLTPCARSNVGGETAWLWFVAVSVMLLVRAFRAADAAAVSETPART